MLIREILNRRAEIRTAMETADPEQFAALEIEAANLNAAENRAAVMADMDRRAAATPIGGASGGADARFDELAASISVVDTIRAQMGDTSAASGRAREVSAELARRSGRQPEGLLFSMAGSPRREQRVLSPLSGSTGANLVQTDVVGMIDLLRAKSVIRSLGATVLSDLKGNVSIPRLSTSATATWTADTTPFPAADSAFNAVLMTPKTCGGIVPLSRQLLLQSSPDVAALVTADLAHLLATALDAAAINGPGAVTAPYGLLAGATGITVVSGAANGLALNWNNVMNLVGAVDTANALAGRPAFLTNARVVKAARQTLKTTQDTASSFIITDPNMLAGFPLANTNNVPSNLTKGSGSNLSALIFGDFSSMMIGFWSEIDILVNPYDSTAYANGGVLVRAAMTCDVEFRHAASFACLNDIIA